MSVRKWLSGRQVEFLFKARPFKEARILPLFATKRWGLLVVNWTKKGEASKGA